MTAPEQRDPAVEDALKAVLALDDMGPWGGSLVWPDYVARVRRAVEATLKLAAERQGPARHAFEKGREQGDREGYTRGLWEGRMGIDDAYVSGAREVLEYVECNIDGYEAHKQVLRERIDSIRARSESK